MPMNPRLLRPTAAGGDPYWQNVSLLLRFDGTNGSTAFVDSSPNALTVTASGNAQISTAQSKFGGASGYFNGSSDYLTVAETIALGGGDFTVECWFYCGDLGSMAFQPLFEFGAGNLVVALTSSGAVTTSQAFVVALGTSDDAVVQAQQWTHCAAARSSGILELYVNGISVLSVPTGADFTTYNSDLPRVAADHAGFFFDGYIDDLRITQGVARYTATFTPPTDTFPSR